MCAPSSNISGGGKCASRLPACPGLVCKALFSTMKKAKPIPTTLPAPPNVVLVGVTLPKQKMAATLRHVEELHALATTGGMRVIKQFVQQLAQPSTRTFIRRGKVEEIGLFLAQEPVQYVIFDDELTPVQTRNLEKAWQCRVWDRSMLILHIFSIHARTEQAKVQVALAQYEYLLPRLVGMWSHLSKQRGGAATMRGPGEKELETDRRMAQQKIRSLKQRLLDVQKASKTQRKQRHKKINVTLVGYTNTGKSTLMQCLSKKTMHVADELFATLSPTVRRTRIEGMPLLLTDTVGFIRKLPHTLVACFKSTLAEVQEADLLLHVVDFSHPHYEDHIQVVHEVLEEIGASQVPRILVLNKQDKVRLDVTDFPLAYERNNKNIFFASESQRLTTRYGMPVVHCSALHKRNIDLLCRVVYHTLAGIVGKGAKS